MIDKSVIDELKAGTIPFFALLSVYANIVGSMLLTHSLTHSLTHKSIFFIWSITYQPLVSLIGAGRSKSKQGTVSVLQEFRG